jgi:RNA polymerase sigma-70 factor (ECF subfamily)
VNSPAEPPGADVALVQAAQNGDRNAFGLLYARYSRMVHGILLSKVPHTAVEDLVQDVFLLALPRLNSLRDVSRFGGWLAAIARNRAMDFHRQSRPAAEFDEESHDDTKSSHPATRMDQSEAQQVLEAIRSLPDTYRETLILRLVEGMTGPEIAARTGLTHGSVRVNLHRGMQQLRELLGLKPSAPSSRESSTQS